MLVIRLARKGRSKQAAYRMVVAEKSNPVKGRFVEVVGFYNPSENKRLEVDEDRVKYWISQGAKPSDTVASLLKHKGMSDMEQYIGRRDKQRPKKNPSEEELAAMEAANAPAEEAPAADAPTEEAAPATEDAPAEEEAPAAEEAAPAAEEAPAEEPAAEEKAADAVAE